MQKNKTKTKNNNNKKKTKKKHCYVIPIQNQMIITDSKTLDLENLHANRTTVCFEP